MSLLQLVESNFQDMAKRFKMSPDCWEKYIVNELMKKQELMELVNLRQSYEDLWDGFQQGLPGTVLNAFCLYGLIRYYDCKNVLETGVANGFYSSFILSAVIENKGRLTSVDLSDHEDIAMYVPYKDYEGWELHTGIGSVEFLKDKVPHHYDLCCHDSLHTKDYMSQELEIFKQCADDVNEFLVFFDDQNSENFWEYCFNINLQSKNGFTFKIAEGNHCTHKGHLGGFIKYERK